MAEICEDRCIQTTKSLAELEGAFPGARVVYSGGQIRSDTNPGVIIWDGAGNKGREKLIRINGACPNAGNGKCNLAGICDAS
jgi:hypothetical protein